MSSTHEQEEEEPIITPKGRHLNWFGRWEYQADGKFIPYDRISNDKIQKAYVNDQDGIPDLEIAGTHYCIEFDTLSQKNVTTSFIRSIRFKSFETIVIHDQKGESNKMEGVQFGHMLEDADLTKLDEDDTCHICLMSLKEENNDKNKIEEKESEEPPAKKTKTETIVGENSDVAVRLIRCFGHAFHKSCISEWLKIKPKCPSCGALYGEEIGSQPPGMMLIRRHPVGLPGNEKFMSLEIFYNFPDGVQNTNHPSPGVEYIGTKRRAFLPDNREGNEVLQLFIRAFQNRVLFTIGTSVTTGQPNSVIWNGIHHKTNRVGGPAAFGYPDPTYLSRVKQELAAKGIV